MSVSFTYYPNIPNAPDNPSYDQPLMQVNSQSIQGIIGVDHVTFSSTGSGGPGASGGQHLQVTLNGKNVPTSVTDPLSVIYSNNIANPGTFNTASASNISQLFYFNQNSNSIVMPAQPIAPLMISAIKAFGVFDGAGNKQNSWNLKFETGVPGFYNFSMPTNLCTGNFYAVFVQINPGGLLTGYAITDSTHFNVQTQDPSGPLAAPAFFSVLVLQL